MKSKILDLDKPNANNRTYPRDVVEKAIMKYKWEMVDKKRALIASELTGRQLNVAKVYGIVDDIYIDGDTVFNEYRTLKLPNVENLTVLVECKKLFPVTAGTGTIKDGIVQDDYKIDYIFLGSDPSYDH